MSGHSHYSTIKRTKEANDAKKGQLFSKLSKAISVAVKTGGGDDPDSNHKLRMAIDQARAANMPKDNIKRAIDRGSGAGEDLNEIVYEGFGPEGVAVIVEVATDNRNRTAQEIKNLFERGGGNLGGPGSVTFNFEQRGLIVVKKQGDSEEQLLKLIDIGVEDVEEADDSIEVYVSPEKTSKVSDELRENGFVVESVELMQKPINYNSIADVERARKVLTFLDKLEDHEDVQKVYANIDIPPETMEEISL
jgi:YebC/PmpR family DNA-binding regulatory protein